MEEVKESHQDVNGLGVFPGADGFKKFQATNATAQNYFNSHFPIFLIV
jgi:hypothetical protein